MKKVWLVAGATMGLMVGVGVVACGNGGSGTGGSGGTGGTSSTTTLGNTTSSNATTSSTTTGDTTSTTTSNTTSTGMGGGGTGGGGGDAGTCKPPGTLHPPKLDAGPGTIFCPFSDVDGGKDQYCVPGTEHCCETQAGGPPSSCQPSGTACGATDTDWQCEDPVADCPSGMECCAPGATLMLGGTMNGMACQNYASKMKSTTCVAAGSCTGIQMCTSDAECPSGKTCTPFSKAGNQVGGCL